MDKLFITKYLFKILNTKIPAEVNINNNNKHILQYQSSNKIYNPNKNK